MSLEHPDRPCAICGELVDTNDSEHVTCSDADRNGEREWAHKSCAHEAAFVGDSQDPAETQ